MANVAVIGAQWGDEGKGKIVDWLSERADIVVRFQGGHNAGHTLVINGREIKLSLLPSSIVRQGRLGLIGNGVVLDAEAFLAEVDDLRQQGIEVSPDNLRIADNVCLILPLHRELDIAGEKSNTAAPIGTTQRGIGPAYEDKAARRALRLADLADSDGLPVRLARMLAHHNALRRGMGMAEVNEQALVALLKSLAPKILPYMGRVWQILYDARREGKRILFEGAQGMLLDVDHGTYPFVTSSNTHAAMAATGSGISPRAVNYVLGIVKAYTTRVGAGPFPTEQDNATGQRLGEVGKEFGTVTGRKRRCGWFDAALVRQSVRQGGIDGIALTKLDVLDGMTELKICTGYRLNGSPVDYLPAGAREQAAVEPVYQTLSGWSASTAGARSWGDLPAEAVKYIRYVEELVGAPVALLSTSPERDDTICVKDPFTGL